MATTFKKKDKIVLTHQLNFRHHAPIPIGAVGKIKEVLYTVNNKTTFSVEFEKFPEVSPAPVHQDLFVALKQEEINDDFLNNNEELSKWLEGYVQQCIKTEIINICKRGLAEGIEREKIVVITALTLEELDEIDLEIDA